MHFIKQLPCTRLGERRAEPERQQTDRDSDSDQRNDELAAPPGTTTKNKRNQVLKAQHSMSQWVKMRQASDPRDGHQNRSADHGTGLKHEAVKTKNCLQQEHQAD
jgi:hypothetical protein